ncbi:MAG: peptidase M61 [Halofilum sp. (in: g-proteobacteria)]
MRYFLSPKNATAHLFGVVLEIDVPDPAGQRLELPAWIPGSYMIRDFARHVITVQASGAEGEVTIEKIDKQTWRCAPARGPLRVSYEVYAWDASVRAAALDADGGFCNGTSVFMRPHNQVDGPYEVFLERATCPSDWRAMTSMPAVAVDQSGFGRYRAANYDELIDHPVRFGECTIFHFTAAGVPHWVVLPGAPRVNGERLCKDLATVCQHHTSLFGELPTEQYVFFMHPVSQGYGGLEHRASTVLDVARSSLPLPGDSPERESYQELLGLCSHEYFHLWNVKRIRPAVFTDPDLSREVHTTLLWAFEGITSYYDDLALCRSGLLPPDDWLRRLARTITRVHRGTGRLRQTLAESSFDAWTRFYKADENAPNAIVSYYAKGALAALALDLTLRLGTQGACSLDDIMRALWQRYGRTGEGVPEDGIERLVTELSGLDLEPFFETALRSTRDLDLSELLRSFGIDLTWHPPEPNGEYSPHLGAMFREDGRFARLQQVFDGRAAQRAGLASGDLLLAIDETHLPAATLGAWLKRLPTTQPLTAHVLRGDRLRVLSVTLDEAPEEECQLRWSSVPVPGAQARRRDWLGEIV